MYLSAPPITSTYTDRNHNQNWMTIHWADTLQRTT